jgi:hypothetical protein
LFILWPVFLSLSQATILLCLRASFCLYEPFTFWIVLFHFETSHLSLWVAVTIGHTTSPNSGLMVWIYLYIVPSSHSVSFFFPMATYCYQVRKAQAMFNLSTFCSAGDGTQGLIQVSKCSATDSSPIFHWNIFSDPLTHHAVFKDFNCFCTRWLVSWCQECSFSLFVSFLGCFWTSLLQCLILG